MHVLLLLIYMLYNLDGLSFTGTEFLCDNLKRLCFIKILYLESNWIKDDSFKLLCDHFKDIDELEALFIYSIIYLL